ncbi:hypothetical protein CURE108131_12970 [Cupriavidus respiraculi]|uniref:Hydroxyquinol 1,2-dioxygenase n=1 Tax=Cupriavidus respiraculi TaxID=195930 RepID=A0ABM8XIP4_9BURK|nr:hypothetical protein [Cupriavidus respiraculi]MBY4948388.1 hypothetical protein [Cupriavidus respiraculi]CAG9180041.1 hypothetical protein LMG21510_03970 [Cupriavidus respiraculi]
MKTLAHSRRFALTLLCAAGLSAAASLAHAGELHDSTLRLDGSAARVGAADPYTDGASAVGARDVYTDGARALNRHEAGASSHVADQRDAFSQGA